MGQQIIFVEGVGFIPIESGQTPTQAAEAWQAAKQARGAAIGGGGGSQAGPGTSVAGGGSAGDSLALRGPMAGQQVGFQMPDSTMINDAGREALGDTFTQALAAFPQLAGLIAQLTPAGRATGMAGSIGFPAMARAATNAIEGKSLGEGVIGEAALGGALHLPTAGGAWLGQQGENMARHTLMRGLPDNAATRSQAERYGKVAIDNRASVTPAGVKDMYDRFADATNKAMVPVPKGGNHAKVYYHPAKKQAADDIGWVAQRMRDLEEEAFKKGTKGGGPTAVLPGSGAVTTATRASGLPAAVGQAASPAIAALKGSPARRMATARNLARPGNAADMSTIGAGTSAIARLMAALEAFNDPITPAVSHTPQRRRP